MNPTKTLAAVLVAGIALIPVARANALQPGTTGTAVAASLRDPAPAAAPVAPSPSVPDESATGGAPSPVLPAPPPIPVAAAPRTGQDVYRSFREGLAEPGACAEEHPRWQQHFAAAPQRLARPSENVMPLFAHVVEQLRAAKLPTEYALIPFVESGYRPQARSSAGPAGLWQLIASTARHFKLTVGNGRDARLSPTESTRAAVDYLGMLHRTFGGNWRLAVMAYNAGENRVLNVLKRQGRSATDGGSAKLNDLPAVTRAYVDKLQALSCVMHQADQRADFQQALDRPIPAVPGATAQR